MSVGWPWSILLLWRSLQRTARMIRDRTILKRLRLHLLPHPNRPRKLQRLFFCRPSRQVQNDHRQRHRAHFRIGLNTHHHCLRVKRVWKKAKPRGLFRFCSLISSIFCLRATCRKRRNRRCLKYARAAGPKRSRTDSQEEGRSGV